MKCKRKKLKAKPKDLEGNTRKVNTQTAHKYLRFVDCEQKERKRQNGEEEKKTNRSKTNKKRKLLSKEE